MRAVFWRLHAVSACLARQTIGRTAHMVSSLQFLSLGAFGRRELNSEHFVVKPFLLPAPMMASDNGTRLLVAPQN
jgi:hypothetical protein